MQIHVAGLTQRIAAGHLRESLREKVLRRMPADSGAELRRIKFLAHRWTEIGHPADVGGLPRTAAAREKFPGAAPRVMAVGAFRNPLREGGRGATQGQRHLAPGPPQARAQIPGISEEQFVSAVSRQRHRDVLPGLFRERVEQESRGISEGLVEKRHHARQ